MIFVNSEEQTNREGEDDELVCQPCDRAFVDSSGAPISTRFSPGI